MPAEILNRLEALVPEIEASDANKKIGTSTKANHLDPLKSELRAMKFIWSLPLIPVDSLNEDETFCALCYQNYDEQFRVCGDGESPCHLPCGHIAGHQCLREWLSPYEGGSTQCPFCSVDFPQMFSDPAEPARPTSDLARATAADNGAADGELSRLVSQLSIDSGIPSDEVKRYLGVDEVLERSRSRTVPSHVGTEARDFATPAVVADPVAIAEGEVPKDRRNGRSPSVARAAMKAIDLIAKML